MVTEQNKDDVLEALYRRGCSTTESVPLMRVQCDLPLDVATFREAAKALENDKLIRLRDPYEGVVFTLAGYRRIEKRLNPAVTQNTVIAGTISNATIQQGGTHATMAQDHAEPFSKRVFTRDHMTVPQSLNDPSTYQRFARYHLIYSLACLVPVFVCVVGGIVLLFHSATGSISWTAKFLGIGESKISDAPAGVILIIVGLLIVFATRFSIKTEKHRENKRPKRPAK